MLLLKKEGKKSWENRELIYTYSLVMQDHSNNDSDNIQILERMWWRIYSTIIWIYVFLKRKDSDTSNNSLLAGCSTSQANSKFQMGNRISLLQPKHKHSWGLLKDNKLTLVETFKHCSLDYCSSAVLATCLFL